MYIQFQALDKSIRIVELLMYPVKCGIFIMNDTVMVWTDNHNVAGVIIFTLSEIVNMMRVNKVGSIGFADIFTADLTAVAVNFLKVIPNGTC